MNTLEIQTDASTTIVEDLVEAIRDSLLRDPITRPAIIGWATQLSGAIEQEFERSMMVTEMLGEDFEWR
jgi:hypothetical protein